MTREEMLNGLYEIKNWKCNGDAKTHEVVTEAIKALEQEPCEDCISRQAVLNEIDRYIEKVQSTGAKDDFISFSELVVKQLPSVTPQPKTGHWVEHGVKEGFLIEKYTCSECDYYSGNRTTNFCPNCGAKMVEPQESEE